MNCETSTACQGLTVDITASPTTWRPAGGGTNCEARFQQAGTPPVTVVTTGC
jgi:hypothetical protein